jgi:hypothetical protein
MTAMARVLEHPEVVRRMVVIAVHHPAVHRWSRVKTYMEGLRDSPELLKQLRSVPRGFCCMATCTVAFSDRSRPTAGSLSRSGPPVRRSTTRLPIGWPASTYTSSPTPAPHGCGPTSTHRRQGPFESRACRDTCDLVS